MKVRCVANSLRLRVRKSDLQALQTDGSISVGLEFPGQAGLTFLLKMGASKQISLEHAPGEVIIALPRQVAQDWINSNEVGIQHEWSLKEEGKVFKLLIEKDFPCRHVDGDTYADTFFELVPESE
ncbi:MAG: hypothetical protein AAFV07_13155 [Bacteroidota bacterium]